MSLRSPPPSFSGIYKFKLTLLPPVKGGKYQPIHFGARKTKKEYLLMNPVMGENIVFWEEGERVPFLDKCTE
jgi:hypothetical protein